MKQDSKEMIYLMAAYKGDGGLFTRAQSDGAVGNGFTLTEI